jgi:hypothetical protein
LSQVGTLVGLYISRFEEISGEKKAGRKEMTMSTKNDDNNIRTDAEACYERVASQEEIYIETTEEELRATLTSEESGKTAEYWRSNREKLELNWQAEILHDRCK